MPAPPASQTAHPPIHDEQVDSMRWPPWSESADSTDKTTKTDKGLVEHLFSTDALRTLALAGTPLALVYVYFNYIRRIPNSSQIPHWFFRRRRSLLGTVTSVGDGDNFRLFHTPGGRLLGWGWFPGRRIPTSRKELKDKTVHIRVAGVDAPEAAHWGTEAQPYSAEALAWLRNYVGGRRVRAYIYSRDQYDRIVASAKVRRGLLQRDVGLQMLRAGMATVYEAKTGAEFGSLGRKKYEVAEKCAKWWKRGMWKQDKARYVSPGNYKKAQRETPRK